MSPTPPSYTSEDVEYIISNIGIESYPIMAKKRNLSLPCVKRLGNKIKKNQLIRSDPNDAIRSDPNDAIRSDPNDAIRSDPNDAIRSDPNDNKKGFPIFLTLDDHEDRLKTLETTIQEFPSLYPHNQIFNLFMEKLEKSNTFSAKHLKEKINVRGKHRKINKERVIRIIRDTLDVINE